MATIKSAKKRARQNIKRHGINLTRKTAIKTAVKKVLKAVEEKDLETARKLLKVAQAQIARAKGKGIFHANTAARKVGRLTKKVNAIAAAQ